jgi:hypothetical protein
MCVACCCDGGDMECLQNVGEETTWGTLTWNTKKEVGGYGIKVDVRELDCEDVCWIRLIRDHLICGFCCQSKC